MAPPPLRGPAANKRNGCAVHCHCAPATDRVCWCCQKIKGAASRPPDASINCGNNGESTRQRYKTNLSPNDSSRPGAPESGERGGRDGLVPSVGRGGPPPGKRRKQRAGRIVTSFVFRTNLLHSKSYFVLLLLPLTILSIATRLFTPTTQTSVTNTYTQSNALQMPYTSGGKNSGQFHITQLCSPRSPFPITRRVEGATLSASPADTDMNCTITFRTKSAQQHFVIRFEELKLSCDDHLVLFDGDLDYGQPSIKDFSCRDNMASVPIIKTTGTFLTLRYSSDGVTKMNDGFRLVATAVFDMSLSDCPAEYVFCRSQLCISRSLFCDGINHCLDNSDELACQGADDSIELPYALGFFVMLMLIISTGVTVCIILHCRRGNDPALSYAAAHYQQHMQRAFGAGAASAQQLHHMNASSSFMFPAHLAGANQYQQFFQATPYVTPTHQPHLQQQQQQAAAVIATLPRGYSTLPLNLVRGQAQAQTILASKANHHHQLDGMIPIGPAGQQPAPHEYVMMTGLAGAGAHLVPQQQAHYSPVLMASAQQPVAAVHQAQRQVALANSQSILSSSTAANVAAGAPPGGPANARRAQQQQQIRSPRSSSNDSQMTATRDGRQAQ